jgi:ferritin-like protein
MVAAVSLYERCVCRGWKKNCESCGGTDCVLNDLGREIKGLLIEVLREELPGMLKGMCAATVDTTEAK